MESQWAINSSFQVATVEVIKTCTDQTERCLSVVPGASGVKAFNKQELLYLNFVIYCRIKVESMLNKPVGYMERRVYIVSVMVIWNDVSISSM